MKNILGILLALFNASIIMAQTSTDSKTSCGACDVLPGQVEKFKSALSESKLHFYTDGGTNKLDLKKAEEECNVKYFSVCNDMLILTSTGEKKDRTELRQKKKLSLNDYSSMYYEAIISNTPKDNEKKGVTIGQIHNSAEGVKRPLLRVEITGSGEIRAVVTDSYIKGEGEVENDLVVPFNDGDKITCKIVIKDSEDEIEVEVVNKTNGSKKELTYTVSELWKEKDGEFYFKAGAYTQVTGPETIVIYNEFKYEY